MKLNQTVPTYQRTVEKLEHTQGRGSTEGKLFPRKFHSTVHVRAKKKKNDTKINQSLIITQVLTVKQNSVVNGLKKGKYSTSKTDVANIRFMI